MRHDKWERITTEFAKLAAVQLENLAKTEKWKPEGNAMLEASKRIREIINEPEPEPIPLGFATPEDSPLFEVAPCDHRSHGFGPGESNPIRWNPYKKIFMCFLCGAEFVEKKDEPTQEKAGD